MDLAVPYADDDDEIYQDMSASSVRDVVKHLDMQGSPAGVSHVDQSSKKLGTFDLSEKVAGVRISCLGELKLESKTKYLGVNVSKGHSIMVKGSVAEISGHMGLPLFVQKLAPNPGWEG